MRESFPLGITPPQFADSVLAQNARVRLPGRLRIASTVAVVTLYAALGFLVTASYGHASVRGQWVLTATLVALAMCMLLVFLNRVGARSLLRRSTHPTTPRTLLVEEAGLRFRAQTHDLFHAWADIARVGDEPEAVYVMLDDFHYYALPPATFESAAERAEFVQHVRARLAATPASAAAPEAAIPAAAPKARGKRVRELANDAIRLVLFSRVAPERMEQSWGTILALALLGVLVPSLAGLWSAGLNAEWSWYSVPGALLHVPLLLAASIAAAYATGRPAAMSGLLCAGLLAALTIDAISSMFALAASGVPNFVRLFYGWQWLPAAWLAMALATYASRLIPRGERRLAIVMACLVLVAVPLANIYRDRALWHAPYDPEDGEGKTGMFGPAGEDAFYKQPALLEQELQSVRAGTKGKVDVFFIGMAGYGQQDVFMREITSVAKMFRERFGSEGHVVRLVNNPRTLLEVPIASKTSLRAALKRVAEVMDKEEDVLVLFMTSHGSEDHRFSLTLWPLRLHEVDPVVLRTLLDESGIKYRVVVVSACYSGGFVKPLESPDTLVITASSADRNSFGCSNEAEWTYFGKAYFNDALATTHSFVKAFEIAKPAIAAREVKERFDRSEPQISLGTNIAARLDELEAQLDDRKTR